MLKNVVLHSVATALASIVLPVPINTNNRNKSNLKLLEESYKYQQELVILLANLVARIIVTLSKVIICH